ncbi:hypothetical protein B0F90DRAFT_1761885 [Multifurca ochricompacta]|uniref:Uncharacterized protein n=1 Tax=Multifurca ochricompacta TaxID=376703 RepID=A0AAD4LXN8_9AGAM|nr:hypothetical protein B0F90DRAFT_1761885 [Multifurca ochricompacta]
MLKTKVKVLDIKLQVRQDEFFSDLLPYDACHLIAIKFNDRFLHHNLLSVRRHAVGKISREHRRYERSEMGPSSRERTPAAH